MQSPFDPPVASISKSTSPSTVQSVTSTSDMSGSLSPPSATLASNLPSTPASSWPTATSTPTSSQFDVSSSENSPVAPSAFCQIDPQQLKFQIGPSLRSPRKFTPKPPMTFTMSNLTISRSGVTVTPSGVTITPLPSSPDTGLFGSSIVKEASRAPNRFKFGQPPAPSVPRAPPAVPYVPDRATSGGQLPATKRLPGTSKQPPIPNLGPDVVIRPVSFRRSKRNNQSKTGQPPHQGSQHTEEHHLPSGYKQLRDEVTSLKQQLLDSQTLIEDIVGSFSREIVKLSSRLRVVEKMVGSGQEKEECGQGRQECGQGRQECVQGRVEHGQNLKRGLGDFENRQESIESRYGGIEYGQGSTQHRQGRMEHKQGNMEHGCEVLEHDQEDFEETMDNDNGQDLSMDLGHMSLTENVT